MNSLAAFALLPLILTITGSPEPTTPSGQPLPGSVTTAPILMVGSAAFIAWEYWMTLFA